MLRIENLIFDAWGRRFFDSASMFIPAGTKVGLVGRNGVGKSTLFKLIVGDLVPLGGEILLPKSARIGSVDQEHPATPISLLDTVLAADARREALNAALETAEPEELADIYQQLNAIDADRAPARAAEILSGLGFSNADLDRPMAEFSGGWRMRVALAAALFARTGFAAARRADQLSRPRRRAVAGSAAQEISSHRVDHQPRPRAPEQFGRRHPASERPQARRSTPAATTISKPAAQRRARLQAATRAKQEAERAHLQRFIDRFRAKASKATQAQSRIKRLAKLEPIAETVEERVAPFTLPSPTRPLAPPLLQLEGAAVGYDGPPVLRNLNLRLDVDDRIGLVGRQRRRQVDLRQDDCRRAAAPVRPDEARAAH